jgi:pyrroline-5-carboxylate reductase
MLRLGFIGAGTLSQAVIAGLQATHADRSSILVSPRSEATSQTLASAYANVTRATSNRAVIEGSDVVFLAMRPQQLDEALEGLTFRPDQIIVSFLAGTPLASVVAKVAPARRVCRVNPIPPIKYRKGPVVMFPADDVVEGLFSGLGDLIVADKESDLAAISHASALMSSHYELQNTVTEWLLTRGLTRPAAISYVRSMFDGLAEVALAADRDGEPLVPEHHETSGGFNERGRRYLREAGWFDQVVQALDVIEAHRPVPSTRP